MDVNKKLLDGWNCLHIAASEGQVDIAEFLLIKGVDINAQTEFKSTALHIAC